MNPKKLHRWYKEVLSEYVEAIESGILSENDIKQQDEQDIKVPILKSENIGRHMAIDEKNIDGVCYSILSNRDSGKIALMASTLKVEHLATLGYKLDKLMTVSSLTRDMASNYDWLGRQLFMNAYHVIDKFHVIKQALDGLQAIRIKYRQEELAKKRMAKESFDSLENSKKIKAQLSGSKYTKLPFKYNDTVFSNGDTRLQLLARARGLLFKRKHEWTAHQKQRSETLFQEYPELHEAYEQVMMLRQWYTMSKEDNLRSKKKEQILKWAALVADTQIFEMENLASTIQRHIGAILNYFYKGETNAKAESLNSRIQRFIHTNYGARNTDYFLFRLAKHFS